jgi:molybdate transport system substrate-binding protein
MRALIAALALLLLPASPRAEAPVTIFAAASLADVLQAAVEARGVPARLVLAGSSALARQIDAGAPADLYISANAAWMDHLEAQGLLADGTRFDLAANALVLVAPAPAPGSATEPREPPALTPDFPLAEALADGRLALALTRAVPAGIYAREALEALGLWTKAAPRLVETDDVRGALALAARGEVPLALVYATDAAAEPRVVVVATVPPEAHAPIRYPAAVIAQRDAPAARAWLTWLAGPEGRALFARHGFTAP